MVVCFFRSNKAPVKRKLNGTSKEPKSKRQKTQKSSSGEILVIFFLFWLIEVQLHDMMGYVLLSVVLESSIENIWCWQIEIVAVSSYLYWLSPKIDECQIYLIVNVSNFSFPKKFIQVNFGFFVILL